jgi:eukaryotic-like serine/threonine-protein kinase
MLTGDVPFKGENQVAVAMKHVREPLPDVQIRRPEVSSALAAVLDRATAKETEHRYPDDRALIADLEDVLAIETQRSGQATGEATAVLRTLPPSAQRKLPSRVRHPLRWVGVLVVVVAAAIALVLLLADNTKRGTSQRPVTKAPAGLKSVSLGQARAHDFDPLGDDAEHHSDVGRVLDDDPGTSWSTESYDGGLGSKAGVGIYVDAKPGVVGKRLDIRTPTTGWTGKIYVANAVEGTAPKTLEQWKDLGTTFTADKKKFSLQLDTAGQKFRYYLVWITKLPSSGQASISEIVLFQ